MQFSKARPSVGIRVNAEAYEKIKQVSYDKRLSLNDALDYLLSAEDNKANTEKWRQAYNYHVEELSAEIAFVNKMAEALGNKKYTADLWINEMAKVEKQIAELNEKIKALGIK